MIFGFSVDGAAHNKFALGSEMKRKRITESHRSSVSYKSRSCTLRYIEVIRTSEGYSHSFCVLLSYPLFGMVFVKNKMKCYFWARRNRMSKSDMNETKRSFHHESQSLITMYVSRWIASNPQSIERFVFVGFATLIQMIYVTRQNLPTYVKWFNGCLGRTILKTFKAFQNPVRCNLSPNEHVCLTEEEGKSRLAH